MNKRLSFQVLWVDSDSLWACRGSKLFNSGDGGKTWDSFRIGSSVWQRLMRGHRLSRRLLRYGVHHLVPLTGNKIIVFVDKEVLCIDAGAGDLLYRLRLEGGRPLSVCVDGGQVFYGEYRQNSERSAVNIWRLSDGEQEWESVWRFENVRHIHGIYSDPFTGYLWVTTGDDNNEAAIWRTTDRFESLEKVVSGSQQTRAVDLIFSEDHVFFGSDTPLEANFIYRLSKERGTVETLQEVGGSIFFGCTVGDVFFFSTACEPSDINSSRKVEVWRSDNGVEWHLFMEFPKDPLPMKLFQYGQARFAAGPGDGENLWVTPFGTFGDQKSIRVPVAKECR